MITHVVECEVRRFYKVYIEDETHELSEAEVAMKAYNLAKETPCVLSENMDKLGIDSKDVMCARYDYPMYH